jgi:hypothetical protein
LNWEIFVLIAFWSCCRCDVLSPETKKAGP